jgi:hypothetical protein
MTKQLVEVVASATERRFRRRGFLARVTVIGAAAASAPLRFLLRPSPAWAETGMCSSSFNCGASCPNGHCDTDQFTAFCCTLTGDNFCPSNTYPGGWWRCDNYTGSQLCSSVGKRWYIDCNLRYWDGSSCTPGCALGKCDNRQACCVCFRYFNCNTDRTGSSVVRCRLVFCGNPGSAGRYQDECSSTGGADNTTCNNEASCL